MATLGMELLSVFSGLWLGAALIVRRDMDRRAEGTVLDAARRAPASLLALLLCALSPALAAFFGEPRLAAIVAAAGRRAARERRELVLRDGAAARARVPPPVRVPGRAHASPSRPWRSASPLPAPGSGAWSRATSRDYLANGAALLAARRRTACGRPSTAGRRGASSASGRGFLAQDLAGFLGQNADYLAVGRVLGPAQLGFYAMAFRQAELPHYAIAEPVGKVTFPAFAQMRHRGEDVRPAFLNTLRLMALATFPVGRDPQRGGGARSPSRCSARSGGRWPRRSRCSACGPCCGRCR